MTRSASNSQRRALQHAVVPAHVVGFCLSGILFPEEIEEMKMRLPTIILARGSAFPVL